jgi:hypothetical protein
MEKILFKRSLNPFSRYADVLERKADRLLSWIVIYDKFGLQKKVYELMQKNLVVLDLWLEKKYKGYKYLTKWNRNKLYSNTQKLVEEFKGFCSGNRVDDKVLFSQLDRFGFEAVADRSDKIRYIGQIMAFLRPGHYYEYLEGASFGKLLKVPGKEKLIGDCNQIVTLYAFLYSLKFPISDLKIKLLPKHVCLHYEGVDIEATNATFQKYREYDHLLSIVELITTNLLDVSDFRDKTLKIDARVLVTAAELAYKLSSMRDLVEGNLKITYHNLAIESAANEDFESAVFFLNKTEDYGLKQNIFHNAVIFYTNKSDFTKARYYLNGISDVKLNQYVSDREGYYYFKQGNITRALDIYRRAGNVEMVKACYGEEYNRLQKKVSSARTMESARYFRVDYQRMKELARLMGDNDLETQVDGILKSL